MVLKNENKIPKKIKIALLILVSIIIYHAIYFYLFLAFDERITNRINEDVIVINDIFSSIYLIKTNSGYIAVDAGFCEKVIRKGLEYNGIDPDEVKVVLLTHTDFDHQNAIDIFRKAKIYLPKDEFDMINKNINRFSYLPLIKNKILAKKYELLYDNQEILIDNKKIKCISLPGHTFGSIGYIVNDKYLFAGDAFRIKNGKLQVPFKKFFVMDINAMKKSLPKIARLKGIKDIFCASGMCGDFEFAVQEWK